jgi:hypothetical protein
MIINKLEFESRAVTCGEQQNLYAILKHFYFCTILKNYYSPAFKNFDSSILVALCNGKGSMSPT